MSTTEERSKSCEERIDAHLAGRIEDLVEMDKRRDVAEAAEDYDTQDEVLEELDNYALCIDVRHTMIVQLSTGGPGDQFEIEITQGDHGWELADREATYRFLDWFDGATKTTDNEAVMRYLGAMVERLSW